MNDPIPAWAPGPHPTPEQLYAARRGPRSEEAERHLAHAAACALCSEELLRQEAFDAPEPMTAREVEAAWARFGEPPAVRRRAPWRFPAPALALAAVLALCVVGLGLWRAAHLPTPDDVTRSGGQVAGEWSPEGIVAAPPEEFVFPNPGGEPRRVTLFDADQHYVWTSPPVAGGRVPFPEAERKRLQPGVEYFWTALGDQGTAPARSFRIRP
jgi:hypothetical protein